MPRRIVSISMVLLATLISGIALVPSGFGPVVARQASPAAGTSCPTTTEEENEALVRRFHEEAWERGNVEVIDEVWAPTAIADLPLSGTFDPDKYKARILEFRTGFPDLQEGIVFAVTEEDLVVLAWTRMGTHLGTWDGAAPTGRDVTWTGLSWYRIACGRIVEGGAESDAIGLRLQVGILTDEELASVAAPSGATPVP